MSKETKKLSEEISRDLSKEEIKTMLEKISSELDKIQETDLAQEYDMFMHEVGEALGYVDNALEIIDELSSYVSVDDFIDKENSWTDDSWNEKPVNEVWSNGSGPGFYETIDYITKDLEENNIPFETFDDGDYTEFIVDTDDEYADVIISKWVGDNYEVSEPDPVNKISFRVPNNILYWNR